MLASIKMINSKTLQHKWLIHQSTTTRCSGSMPICIQTLLNIMLLTCWRQTYSRYYIYRSQKWSCIHTYFSPVFPIILRSFLKISNCWSCHHRKERKEMMNTVHDHLWLPEWPNKKVTSYCDSDNVFRFQWMVSDEKDIVWFFLNVLLWWCCIHFT